MSSGKVFIAVDALGADNAPSVVLDGVKQALEQDKSLNVLLCGPKKVVECFCILKTLSLSLSLHYSKNIS